MQLGTCSVRVLSGERIEKQVILPSPTDSRGSSLGVPLTFSRRLAWLRGR